MFLLAMLAGVTARAETPARRFSAAADYVRPGDPPSPERDSLVASLEGRPIGRIVIHPRNIYDPIPPGAIGSVLRLANRLHVRTRTGTIRSIMLFREGDSWSDAKGRETARLLRALDYLYPRRIEARSLGDSVEVLIETNDVWSTRLEGNFESFEGRAYGSVALNELNFIGLGKSMSLVYREDPDGIFRTVAYSDPSLLGSRVQLQTYSSTGTTGSSDQYSIELPFYAEDTPYAFGINWVRDGSRPQLYQRGAAVAELDKRLRQSETYWGISSRDRDMIRRFTTSLFIQDRELGPTRVTPDAAPGFKREADNLLVRRLAVEGRLWRPRFIERTFVNRQGFTEDYDIGSSFSLKLGYSPKAFGSTAGEGYVQMKLDAGAQLGSGFGWVRTGVSGRVRREPREVLATVDARWMQPFAARHALVLAARGISASRMPSDFQTGVGGLTGLRAYPVHALAGRRLWRFNAEGRWTVAQDYADLLTIGIVAFTDAARAWGTGAEGTTWHYSAGTGLRLSLPLWSQSRVIRVDVAWPISPTRDGKRQPVLSFGSSQAF